MWSTKVCSGLLHGEVSERLTFDSGELQSVDGYMNIALEQTRELVDGKLRRSYGDAFVRGNNGESQGCRLLWQSLTELNSHVHLGRLVNRLDAIIATMLKGRRHERII